MPMKESRQFGTQPLRASLGSAVIFTWHRTRCITLQTSHCKNKSLMTSATFSMHPTCRTRGTRSLRRSLPRDSPEAYDMGGRKHCRRPVDLRYPKRAPQANAHDKHARTTKPGTKTSNTCGEPVPNEASLLRLVAAVLVELSYEWETGM